MSENEPLETDESLAPLPEESPPFGKDAPSGDARSVQVEFADFYRRFVPKLVGFLVWMGAPLNVAADMSQETMVKAYLRWRKIEYPEQWARKVASRELVRWFSRVDEESVVDIPETASALLPDSDGLADWESKHEILQILKLLPPRQRQVLAWTVDGYSPTEIAGMLDIEPTAVRANLMKARRSVALHITARQEES
jgi:RNA polymerase sigma factor (sigma-70 family)